MSRYTSSDGLMSSSEPTAVQHWNAIGLSMASAQAAASAALRDMGVKMEHPDDGWVHEPGRGYTPDDPRKWISPCYPRFDERPEVGDLIALGWPRDGYRLVRVTEVAERRVFVGPRGLNYFYEDTGRTVRL